MHPLPRTHPHIPQVAVFTTGLDCCVVPGASSAPTPTSEQWDLFASQIGSDVTPSPLSNLLLPLTLRLLIVAGWVP